MYVMRKILRGACLTAFLLLLPAAGESQVDIEFERARMKAILNIVSREVEKNFYDPQMRGVDWKALTDEARGRIEKANSPSAMITAIFSLVDKLQDSHTVFIPPSRAAKLKFGFEAKAFGKEVRIYEIDKKGAAAAAGLQVGDLLVSINGFAAERETLELMLLYLRRLRPTPVLEIEYRRAAASPQKIRLQAKLEQGLLIEDLTDMNTIYKYIREAEMDKEVYRHNMYEGDIGYLALPSFSGEEGFLHGLLNKVRNSKAMIIDLRGNPGGTIKTLEQVAGYFETSETVMANIVGRKKTEPVKIKPRKPSLTGPMFILVDSQSASAAEMFARHFQRTGRAKVIGDQTPGRVTASRIHAEQIGVDIVVMFGIQVAEGRVVFPDGLELEKRGVIPDQPCIPSESDLRRDSDPCHAAALLLARKALGLSQPEPEIRVVPPPTAAALPPR